VNRVAFVSVLLVSLSTSIWAATQGPEFSYFTNVRDIRVAQPGVQNYFLVDGEIWSRSRPDLGDMRIYDGERQVQYALSEQRGDTSVKEETARILNLGSVGEHTEFDLDMEQAAEYDRVRLDLDAKNFVATVSLTGNNALGQATGTKLPSATLYDFTRTTLGSNLVLKLPASSFRYLHVSISPGISPQQVKGATVYNLQETKTIWSTMGSCGPPTQTQRNTEIICQLPPKVPLDRIHFQVDPGQVNFRRTVNLMDSSRRYLTGGEITRVRLNRAGTTTVSEEMDVQIRGQNANQLVIAVDNGDNPPLAIAGVQLLAIERRVYFDPQEKSSLKLFYGDDKLEPPVYDYARFLHVDPAAVRAELGPGTPNDAYRMRPDSRPWSERHNVVLWLAMLLAVVVLTSLAIRGLKAEAGKMLS
jgi:hypothetical protein